MVVLPPPSGCNHLLVVTSKIDYFSAYTCTRCHKWHLQLLRSCCSYAAGAGTGSGGTAPACRCSTSVHCVHCYAVPAPAGRCCGPFGPVVVLKLLLINLVVAMLIQKLSVITSTCSLLIIYFGRDVVRTQKSLNLLKNKEFGATLKITFFFGIVLNLPENGLKWLKIGYFCPNLAHFSLKITKNKQIRHNFHLNRAKSSECGPIIHFYQ